MMSSWGLGPRGHAVVFPQLRKKLTRSTTLHTEGSNTPASLAYVYYLQERLTSLLANRSS
eukprot:170860-Pyramimonas_sp.AAC.2